MRRRRRNVLLALLVTALAARGYDAITGIMWVGWTDLDVEFIVKDADTDQPIAGAVIAVDSEGGLYHDRFPQSFRLTTGPDGSASYRCRGMMCGGRVSGLSLTRSYACHIPDWLVRVHAPGYEPTEQVWLEKLQHPRFVERLGPKLSRLVVPIRLRKNQP